MANSIYILKNKIYCEDIEKNKGVDLLEASNDLDNNPTEFNMNSISKKEKEMIQKMNKKKICN